MSTTNNSSVRSENRNQRRFGAGVIASQALLGVVGAA